MRHFIKLFWSRFCKALAKNILQNISQKHFTKKRLTNSTSQSRDLRAARLPLLIAHLDGQ
ncbi:hypothetical protein BKN38_03545 [Helicobacter sp. CLO-3]|nr:hypothetical protein BA723_08430 [Helicobacter sp. CLO-3]OHU84219.1 hypothetical protein BKN38_03545 [Helicobacter sp. CLO-3]